MGWILIHRKLFENPLYSHKPFCKAMAWIDLLLLANHHDEVVWKRGIKIIVGRGETACGTRVLAERWGWSRGKVHRFLTHLEDDGQIEQKTGPSSNPISYRICIINYDKYQRGGAEDDTADGAIDSASNKEVIKKKTINPCQQDRVPVAEIVSAYLSLCPSFPRLRGELTEARKRQLRARWMQHKSLDPFRELFGKAEASDFLSGRSGQWRATFDWLINETNMQKVLEGNYDNKKGGGCKSLDNIMSFL